MNHIMAVCDAEEPYAAKLVNYLNMKEKFPFDVRHFSSPGKIREFAQTQRIEATLVSECFYEELAGTKEAGELIILCENEMNRYEGKKAVAKYQSCEAMIKEVLRMLSLENNTNCHILRKTSFHIIGFYSPVKRNLQTSFAFTIGQLLAKKSKTLYLNMEGFSGLNSMLKKNFSKDLSDLLYYLQNGKNGMPYLLAGMTENINGLDILPPMMCQIDLISITQKEWICLLQELEQYTDYEYLILDISDSVQGLFEILRQCTKIYTIDGNDGFARAKIDQYEKMLSQCHYEDVLHKTSKCSFPQFTHLPEQLERMSVSELAWKAKEILREDFDGER
ncbi:MAG: hypothetical protein PUB13_04345 [Lachnospiraceae bacterium]|nr:hypothetical protein [Lachnospiraceae bacterium]